MNIEQAKALLDKARLLLNEAPAADVPISKERLLELCGGNQPHRWDWTQGMLPDGWRPMLLKEVPQLGDLFLSGYTHGWEQAGVDPRHGTHYHTRTRRPFPPERKTVPLGPRDVPPGSVFRQSDGYWMTAVNTTIPSITFVNYAGPWAVTYEELTTNGWQILRPGETEWRPCSKLEDATP